MGKSIKVKSSHIRFGRRTYFFDVNTSDKAQKYLRITESQFLGEGKDRKYNSFILFPQDIEQFQQTLKDIAGILQ